MLSRPIRLAVIASHPIQYYAPWFRMLAGEADFLPKVFYLWDFGVSLKRDRGFGRKVEWDLDLLEGYESEFVPNRSPDPGTHGFAGLRNPELPSRVRSFNPNVIIVYGYKYETLLRLFLHPALLRTPILFRGDSHLLAEPRPGWRKRLALGVLFRRFAGFLSVGNAHSEYLRKFGVRKERIFFCPHSVDGQRFRRTAESEKAATGLRTELGIPAEDGVLLFIGKFEEKKRPDLLLRLFDELDPPGIHLVFSGSGPMEARLREAGRRSRVHFLSFANQTEMPVRYALGDILVLPSLGSYETWGLAVNEAMHMGVPALVSSHVGCHPDLVTPGETGWVFDARNESDFRLKLIDAITVIRDRRLREIGENARVRVNGYSYERATLGLRRAIAACVRTIRLEHRPEFS